MEKQMGTKFPVAGAESARPEEITYRLKPAIVNVVV
jgi:hypothetical protein